MTTNKRQLRLLISGVLSASNVDDLSLEARLTDAVMAFIDDTKRGQDAAEVRQRMIDALGGEINKQRQYEKMTQRIDLALHVLPDGSDTWNEVIKWAVKRETEYGQTIEKYGEWCRSNPYSAPKAHQIAQKPGLIKATWSGAFPQSQSQTYGAMPVEW